MAGRRRLLGYAGMTLIAVVALVPFLWMLSTSLKSIDEVFIYPPKWIPDQLRFDNYTTLWRELPMNRWMVNSILVAFTGVVGHLLFCSLSAYAFARIHFPFREPLFYLFLITMLVPGQVQLIPNFVLMRNLGWIDTYWALIMPGLAGAFGTFLLRQFFMTVPTELEEAARVDGCGPIGSFLRIMLTLARPAIAVLTVFTFISFWGSFLWPLIIVNSVADKGTVPLGLAQFIGQQGTQWNLMMAASVLAMLPTVLLVILLQKHLVRGLLVTGLGGR